MNMNYKNYKDYEFSAGLLEQAVNSSGVSYLFEKTIIDGPANTIELIYYLVGDIMAKEKDRKLFALTEGPEDAKTISIHLDNPGIAIEIYKTVSEETWERQAIIDKCKEKEFGYYPCSAEEMEEIYAEYLKLKATRHPTVIMVEHNGRQEPWIRDGKLKIQDDLELAYFHIMD